MDFPFDPKNLCKILAHECNNQVVGGWNCPAGEHFRCPFDKSYSVCDDVTWKDWRDFFNDDGKHERRPR